MEENGFDFASLDNNFSSLVEDVDVSEKVLNIPLSEITPDENQIRSQSNKGFFEREENDVNDANSRAGGQSDSLTDLVESIKDRGVRQPIIVRHNPKFSDNADNKEPKYVIVSGERRYRASIKAGKNTIPALIRNFSNNFEYKCDQIIENIQRVGVTNFETAIFINDLKKSYAEQHNGEKLKSLDIAKMLGKSAQWVSIMESFNRCPDELRSYFKDGTISPSSRVGYLLITTWEKEPELTAQWFNDAKVNYSVIDRSAINKLLKFIQSKKDPSNQTDLEDQSVFNDPQAENTEENASGPASADLNSADDLDITDAVDDADVVEDQETEDSSADDEYPESSEREHSAKPAMSSGSGSSSAPTAGIGKPDYTDRDTRATYDPADHMDDHNEEPDPDSNDDEVQDVETPANSDHAEKNKSDPSLSFTFKGKVNIDGKLVNCKVCFEKDLFNGKDSILVETENGDAHLCALNHLVLDELI